jgi:hypothetical protein
MTDAERMVRAAIDKQKLEVIMFITAAVFNVDKEQIKSRTRVKELRLSRQVVHFLAKKLTDLTLKQIGREVGGLDHATVINSVKAITRDVGEVKGKPVNLELREAVATIERSVLACFEESSTPNLERFIDDNRSILKAKEAINNAEVSFLIDESLSNDMRTSLDRTNIFVEINTCKQLREKVLNILGDVDEKIEQLNQKKNIELYA